MNKLYKYIISNLSSTFFPIFFTLFAIISVIFLVKISSLTSIITINLSELVFLYTLQIPVILFFTLPITFFVAATISIAKLSSEYELIVITSFGLSPIKILYLLLPITLLMSILLFIISFIIIPKSLYLENAFLNKKKQEARFNIKPSEYGQKFGPWYMYVNSKKDDYYKNIILYKNKDNIDTFIIASKAKLFNNTNSLSLELFDGTSSIISNNLKFIEFSKMNINTYLKQSKPINSLKDLIQYWINKLKNKDDVWLFLRNIYISLMPILSILLYISFGYFNPRYQKNYSTLFAILFIVLYSVIIQKLSLLENISHIYYFVLFWLLLSIFIYNYRIKKYY